MKKNLSIKLVCTDFPGQKFECWENVFLGVQRNKEVLEETPGNSVSKTFLIPIQFNTGKNGEPNFLGPYVFGKTGDKFLYLVWYAKNGTEKNMFRRAKIKLNVLSWEQINNAVELNQSLIAHIKLKDKKGGPVCASLKEDHIRWGVDS